MRVRVRAAVGMLSRQQQKYGAPTVGSSVVVVVKFVWYSQQRHGNSVTRERRNRWSVKQRLSACARKKHTVKARKRNASATRMKAGGSMVR